MAIRKTLNDLIGKSKRIIERSRINLDEKQNLGFTFVSNNVKNGGLGVGIGPPGTGKTIVFNFTHAEVMDEIGEEEAIVHVAPTNRLVEETAIKTIALLLARGYDVDDLRDMIRVYGSQFESQRLDEDVKLVITTGYQPSALASISKYKRSVHLMIDEASTTALHEVFIPLSISLIKEIEKENVKYIGSFNVIGDPMQAIVESYSPRWKYEQLIVYRMTLSIIPESERREVLRNPPKIFEIAEKYANSSNIKYFFLDRTYRMPSPTEMLISEPFYDGKLTSAKVASDALKDIELAHESRDRPFMSNTKLLSKHTEVKDALDNAFESHIPVVYVKDEGPAYSINRRRPPELDEYDEFRALLGAEVAAYIALKTNVSRILVTAPYNEMVQQARIHVYECFHGCLGDRINDISFGTVHSVLGSEADVVIAIVGKEYVGEKHKTIYFQMPELVNVQLSRHSKMLVIVGNIEILADNMKNRGEGYKHVGRLARVIEDLKDRDSIKIVRETQP